MMRCHLPACLVLLLMAAPALAQQPLHVPFDLAVGESTQVGPNGLTVGFVEIQSDSRCPGDAICVWSGDAAAALWAAYPGEDPVDFVLHTYYDWEQYRDVGDDRVVLLQVAPYPYISSGPIDPATYVVTLLVTGAGTVHNEPVAWGGIKALYR